MSSREAFEGAYIDEDRAGMNGLVDSDGFKQGRYVLKKTWEVCWEPDNGMVPTALLGDQRRVKENP